MDTQQQQQQQQQQQVANGDTDASMNVQGSEPAAAAASEPAAASAESANPELARLQSRVAAAPQDFDAWVSLVAEAEKTRDADLIRTSTRGLLEEFPLCFGYWQRLAKFEASLGDDEASERCYRVCEEGLEAIPHSHELWTFYAGEMMKNENKKPDEIRSVFVRASSAISTDSTASAFWDKYLEFELAQFASPAVQASLQVLPPPYTGTLIGALWALILSVPLRDLDRFWGTFTHKFCVNYPLNYIASPEEAAHYTAIYPTEVPEERKEAAERSGQAVPTLTDYVNEWELEQRRQLLAKRDYAFRVSLGLRDEKHLFEAAISRPYFHVAPLTQPELTNWSNYLDFLESKLMRNFVAHHPPAQPGGELPALLTSEQLDPLLLADTLKLYERCLIACARYADYWDRYASFLEAIAEPMRAYETRQRCLIFLKRNAVAGVNGAQSSLQDAMVALAEMEEKQGNVEQAREMYKQAIDLVLKPIPTPAAPTSGQVPPSSGTDSAASIMEAHLAFIQFERRQWQAQHSDIPFIQVGSDFHRMYETALERLDPKQLDASAPPTLISSTTKSYTFLSLHYAQFLLTQTEFKSGQERIDVVRKVYETTAEIMFPKPVTTTTETPAPTPAQAPPATSTAATNPTGADGTATGSSTASPATAAAPATVTTTTTTIPKLPTSEHYLTFWLKYIEFETTTARSNVGVIKAIYERVLRQKPPLSASVAAANPAAAAMIGASGLTDAARKQLWSHYVTMMEDRAVNLSEVDDVKQMAKTAMSASATTAPTPVLSVLGKRKHTASPQPIHQATAGTAAKVPRAMGPPPRSYGRGGGYGGDYGGYGGGYGGGGGYGHGHGHAHHGHGYHGGQGGGYGGGYQQQQYGGGGYGGGYQQQYGQYPQQ